MCHYPDGTSDWPCHVGNCFNQSEEPHRSGQWWVISMEFLCLLLRRHFAGKSVVRRKMSTVCSGCSLLRSYFGLIMKCYCVPPQGKGRRVAWRNKHGCVGLRLTQHQSSFMRNLKITNGNNFVLQYVPVRMTVPENSLQSFLTMANPIPLFAPVTFGIEFIFAKL